MPSRPAGRDAEPAQPRAAVSLPAARGSRRRPHLVFAGIAPAGWCGLIADPPLYSAALAAALTIYINGWGLRLGARSSAGNRAGAVAPGGILSPSFPGGTAVMRFSLLPRTLRSRLAVAFSLLLLLIAVTVTLAFARQAARTHVETQQQLAQKLMVLVEPAVRGMIANFDITGLDRYMSRIVDDPAIASIRIIDENGGALLYGHEGNTEPRSRLARWVAGARANSA